MFKSTRTSPEDKIISRGIKINQNNNTFLIIFEKKKDFLNLCSISKIERNIL